MVDVELDATNRHSIGTSEAAWILPVTIRDLAADDPSLIAELIEAFNTDTSLRLVQMRESIANADINACRNAAHTIKGSALQMGAAVIAILCQELELAAIDTPASELGRRVSRLEQCVAEVCHEMDSCVTSSALCQGSELSYAGDKV
jgi:histidine phosphotransfer protein HptB